MWNPTYYSLPCIAPTAFIRPFPVAPTTAVSPWFPRQQSVVLQIAYSATTTFLCMVNEQLSYKTLFSDQKQHIRQGNIIQRALKLSNGSSFDYMYCSGWEPTLITMTKVNDKAFSYFLSFFQPLHNRFTPCILDGVIQIRTCHDRGRPRSVAACQVLGLFLAQTNAKILFINLSYNFGCTAILMSLFILCAIRMVLKVLANNRKAKL